MKNLKCLIIWATIAVALPYAIGGCAGGGGDGDGGNNGDDGITYSGLTNEAEINELRESYDLSISEIKIDLGSANSNQKKIVTSFARKFHSLDDDDLSKIKRLLNKKDR